MKRYGINFLQVTSGLGHPPTAALQLLQDGAIVGTIASIADGPFDAIWKSVVAITRTNLKRYGQPVIESIGPGDSSSYIVKVKLKDESGNSYEGQSIDKDPMTAYGYACVEALNKALIQ